MCWMRMRLLFAKHKTTLTNWTRLRSLALPDLLGLLYHVDQQLENRLSLKPHLDAVDNDI
jgi:hypothetical protein